MLSEIKNQGRGCSHGVCASAWPAATTPTTKPTTTASSGHTLRCGRAAAHDFARVSCAAALLPALSRVHILDSKHSFPDDVNDLKRLSGAEWG